MTIDTKQLAQDIARVMSIAHKNPRGKSELEAAALYHEKRLGLQAEIPTMLDIIRRQQDVIRELVGAMQKAKEDGCVKYLDTCDDGGEFWHSALALAEPLLGGE